MIKIINKNGFYSLLCDEGIEEKTSVATRTKRENKHILHIHCLWHSLNLSIATITKLSKNPRDVIDICLEITKLIKHSPKWETLLGA